MPTYPTSTPTTSTHSFNTTAYPSNTTYQMEDFTTIDLLNQYSDGLIAIVPPNDLYLPLELLWGLNLFYEIAKFALQIIMSSKRHIETSVSPM